MKSLNVVGYSKYCVTNEGKIFSLYSNRILKESMRGDYLKVTLCNEDGHKDHSVHRLVALVYCEGFKEGLVVNHKDGDKFNNSPKNLEWVTHQENTIHSWKELKRVKTPNSNRNLSHEDCHEVCKMIEQGFRNKDIASIYNIAPETICNIKSGRDYKEISKEYSFDRTPNRQKLSTDKILDVCERLQNGENMASIRRNTKISLTAIRGIKNRKTNLKFSEGYVW